ncbi:hypothetical protein HDU85_000928 [Gaertneriomyces sp. JEL0708]|nr:hypothetical protein HDU85_000928 [Gaertneriomyces sp. JEL0708]
MNTPETTPLADLLTSFEVDALYPQHQQKEALLYNYNSISDSATANTIDNTMMFPISPSLSPDMDLNPVEFDMSLFESLNANANGLEDLLGMLDSSSHSSGSGTTSSCESDFDTPFLTEFESQSLAPTITVNPTITQFQPNQTTIPSQPPQQPVHVKGRPGRKPKPRPTDPTEILRLTLAKRAKNTEAARRSRLRKMKKAEDMEERIRALEEEKADLERVVQELRGAVRGCRRCAAAIRS